MDYADKYEEAIDILADVREILLPLVNANGNICGDMLACTVSQPSCIKHLAEQISKQYIEQQKEVEQLKEVYQDQVDDIEFYWGMFHQIENVRLNPDTTDDEKWGKIGELISSILNPNEFD